MCDRFCVCTCRYTDTERARARAVVSERKGESERESGTSLSSKMTSAGICLARLCTHTTRNLVSTHELR